MCSVEEVICVFDSVGSCTSFDVLGFGGSKVQVGDDEGGCTACTAALITDKPYVQHPCRHCTVSTAACRLFLIAAFFSLVRSEQVLTIKQYYCACRFRTDMTTNLVT